MDKWRGEGSMESQKSCFPSGDNTFRARLKAGIKESKSRHQQKLERDHREFNLVFKHFTLTFQLSKKKNKKNDIHFRNVLSCFYCAENVK